MAIDQRFFEQARTFITETMKSVIPSANVDGGSGINALLGRGGATISASVLQEIEHMLTTRDLSDPDALTEEDMDLLLSNLLTSRDGGDLAFGFVRLYYATRTRREFSAGLAATVEDGSVTFVTLSDLVFEAQDYFLDSDTDLYFINVPFVAEDSGEEYNIDPGDITRLTNDSSGATRVTNVESFRNGLDKQTNTQALRKAQRSVSTRTPLSVNGSIFFMQELFGAKLKDLLVVGAGDDEMLRDEVFDLGATEEPRFQIGVDSLDPVTREQLGSAQQLHVGGRTDLYSIFDNINYVSETVDLFADMTLDAAITGVISSGGTIQATIVSGTTGVVAASGKLIIDLGETGEETVPYSSRATSDNNTFVFTISADTTANHLAGATVKVVNNSEISVGEDGDITILPVFQIADIRLLDPVTFEPIGSSLVETTEDSRKPGWYVGKTNRYDLLSARETKSIFIDEKRDATLWPGNQPQTGTAGSTSSVVVGGGTYTKYENSGADFTGYQGREITLSGGITTVTRTIVDVLSVTEVVLSGSALTVSPGDVDFSIDAGYGEFSEFPVRVNFYTNTELAEAQQFLDQDSRRILAGDMLSRSFLPVFLDFTLRYRGDGDESAVRDAVNEVLKTSSGDAIGESEGAQFEYSDLINAAYTDGLANYVETPFQVRIRRLQLDGSFSVDYINPGDDTVNELAVRVAPGVVFFSGDGSYTVSQDLFTTAGGYTFMSTDVGRRIWINGVGIVNIIDFISGSVVQVDTTFTAGVTGVNWSFPASFLEAELPSSVEAFTVPASGRLFLGAFTSNIEDVEYSDVVVEGSDRYTFILKEDSGITLQHSVNEPLRVSTADYDDDNVIRDGIITDERIYRPFLGQVVIEKL